MAAGTSPIFVSAVRTVSVQLANADGTTNKAFFTAHATNGSKILVLSATTTDTANNDVFIYVKVGGSGTAIPLGGVRVAALSGAVAANPTAAVNLLLSGNLPLLQPDGSIVLGPGDAVEVSVQAAVTAAKTLSLFAQVGDY